MYDVHIERRAVKELEKIDKNKQRIIARKALTLLSCDPFPRGDNPLRLKGEQAYRLRIGDYRVLYMVADNLVLIYAIRHRKDAYR